MARAHHGLSGLSKVKNTREGCVNAEQAPPDVGTDAGKFAQVTGGPRARE